MLLQSLYKEEYRVKWLHTGLKKQRPEISLNKRESKGRGDKDTPEKILRKQSGDAAWTRTWDSLNLSNS